MSHYIEEALAKAKADGHDLGDDPPVFSSVQRYTCKSCGRALLINGFVIYGSAREMTCAEAKKQNEEWNRR